MGGYDLYPVVPPRLTIAQLPNMTASDSGAIAECTNLNGGSGLVRWSGTSWERLQPLRIREVLTAGLVIADTVIGTVTRKVSFPKNAVLYDGIPLFSFQLGAAFPVGWVGVGNKDVRWKPAGYTGDAADITAGDYVVEYETLEVF